jgi:hypothetical protein
MLAGKFPSSTDRSRSRSNALDFFSLNTVLIGVMLRFEGGNEWERIPLGKKKGRE